MCEGQRLSPCTTAVRGDQTQPGLMGAMPPPDAFSPASRQSYTVPFKPSGPGIKGVPFSRSTRSFPIAESGWLPFSWALVGRLQAGPWVGGLGAREARAEH